MHRLVRIREPRAPRSAFTLVEVLTATTLTLIMMGAVVTIFGRIGTSVGESRSVMEMAERLRATANQLQEDLAGVTVSMSPQRPPEAEDGYFEIIEGPRGLWGLEGRSSANINDSARNSIHFTTAVAPDPMYPARTPATDYTTLPLDSSVGDNDDILMFTTRSRSKPFIGRYGSALITIQSQVAEVAWFIRGHTLYRRVLLVVPAATLTNIDTSHSSNLRAFYDNYDISAHWSTIASPNRAVPNTLGDLTWRENRFAHPSDKFPYDVRRWAELGLPTLAEQSLSYSPKKNNSSYTYVFANPFQMLPPSNGVGSGLVALDYWSNFLATRQDLANPSTSNTSTSSVLGATIKPTDLNPLDPSYLKARWADDVILDNVIGFDVKVWDPGAPIIGRYLPNPGGTGTQLVALKPGDPGYMSLNSGNIGGKFMYLGYGAFVDLGYPLDTTLNAKGVPNNMPVDNQGGALSIPRPQFAGPMANLKTTGALSHLAPLARKSSTTSYWFQDETFNSAAWARGRVYDTWSLGYNRGGLTIAGANVTLKGTGTNGFDDDTSGTGYGIVDDPEEMEVPPPYAAPLKAVQVKIRTYDPSSRQVREMTVVQDFLPQ